MCIIDKLGRPYLKDMFMKKHMIYILVLNLICLPAQASVVIMKQKAKTNPPVQPLLPINCNHKIPASTKIIDESLVQIWAQRAAIQSFSFDSNTVNTQLDQLQTCYTEEGWKEFKEAMVKSGNIIALKENKLNMSGQIVGQVQFLEANVAQWKVRLPLEVVYQNTKGRASQKLSVDLTIGRKTSGDLGIMHIVATLVSPNK